mmetsp:Transcript_50738/g.142046  ORF Transcript_50738/g.142046 Transcript_50738/m.142046 type:complete len:207 (-) Transcript_50738:1032-1652(-)
MTESPFNCIHLAGPQGFLAVTIRGGLAYVLEKRTSFGDDVLVDAQLLKHEAEPFLHDTEIVVAELPLLVVFPHPAKLLAYFVARNVVHKQARHDVDVGFSQSWYLSWALVDDPADRRGQYGPIQHADDSVANHAFAAHQFHHVGARAITAKAVYGPGLDNVGGEGRPQVGLRLRSVGPLLRNFAGGDECEHFVGQDPLYFPTVFGL